MLWNRKFPNVTLVYWILYLNYWKRLLTFLLNCTKKYSFRILKDFFPKISLSTLYHTRKLQLSVVRPKRSAIGPPGICIQCKSTFDTQCQFLATLYLEKGWSYSKKDETSDVWGSIHCIQLSVLCHSEAIRCISDFLQPCMSKQRPRRYVFFVNQVLWQLSVQSHS